jgi:hypothetical protein
VNAPVYVVPCGSIKRLSEGVAVLRVDGVDYAVEKQKGWWCILGGGNLKVGKFWTNGSVLLAGEKLKAVGVNKGFEVGVTYPVHRGAAKP